MKTKFRASKTWRDFRHKINVKQKGLDPITGHKLRKNSNLHHMNLSPDCYQDLTNEDNFVFVNHNTHKWLHEIYTFYKKDPLILERLKYYLDRMVEINA